MPQELMITRTSNPTFRPRLPFSCPLSNMKTRSIDSTDLKGGAFAALPDGDGRYPGVVVIHEAYGLNENIKDITRRFAENGYAALAVDLFTGRNRALCMARYMAGMISDSEARAGISGLKLVLCTLDASRTVLPA